MGEMVQFPFAGGTTGGYLSEPKNGSGPGVVVIQEWWGLVDHIKDVCDRFAAEGFVALAPDLYHGKSAKSPDEALPTHNPTIPAAEGSHDIAVSLKAEATRSPHRTLRPRVS